MQDDPRFEELRRGGEERWDAIRGLEGRESDAREAGNDASAEARAEAAVASARLSDIEARERARMKYEKDVRMRRISMRIAYSVLALACAVVIALLIVAIDDVQDQSDRTDQIVAQLRQETEERRHQVCLGEEREHLDDVDRLKRTYAFLSSLQPGRDGDPIVRAVLVQLPVTERDARDDLAPKFCDEPGERAEKLYEVTDGRRGAPPVGLPEPDPEVPDRPAAVDRLFDRMVEQVQPGSG